MLNGNLRTLSVVVALLVGLLLWRPWEARPGAEVAELSTPPLAETQEHSSPSHDPSAASVPRAESKRKVNKQERQRYRRAIRDALSRRHTGTAAKSTEAPSKSAKDDERDSERAPLTDRSDGKLAGLMMDLQQDVMPLADECYAQGLGRDPALQGGLDLQFQIIGDEDVGGLVESVELLDSSEISDPEMLECIRETLLSTIFPAPDDSGAKGVKLTLRFAPDEAD